MNHTVIASELVRIAKTLISELEKPVIVSVFSFEPEDGKFYSEGSHPMRDRRSALSHAGEYVREGYDVVVWQGDTLIAYGGRFNEQTAMRHGTGTVNRLTKTDLSVRRIQGTTSVNATASELVKLAKELVAGPTIHLIEIGQVDAKLGSEVKVGDVLLWNYGFESEVVKVDDHSPSFVLVTMKENDAWRKPTGGTVTRKLKKDRLVGYKTW
jgi:hypothetical protein